MKYDYNKEILSKYENLDDRVNKFIAKTVNALESKNIKISDYIKMILELLVSQLIIYYKALDTMISENSTTTENDYGYKSKSPTISVMQTANDKILTLLDKIAISPLSEAKIKKLNKNDEESAQELLDALIN